MRKVTTVVVVLITSCQESVNPNRGPTASHTTTRSTAAPKLAPCPVIAEMRLANRLNHDPLWPFPDGTVAFPIAHSSSSGSGCARTMFTSSRPNAAPIRPSPIEARCARTPASTAATASDTDTPRRITHPPSLSYESASALQGNAFAPSTDGALSAPFDKAARPNDRARSIQRHAQHAQL